jgi:F-type H+-transporting ATPase subunit c
MTKRTIKILFSLSTLIIVLSASAIAYAQEANAVDVARASAGGWIGLGAGLAIALAAFGGALGQGRAAAAALEGIARNPQAADKVFTPLILGLALIESLVIYALIIAILLQGKIG